AVQLYTTNISGPSSQLALHLMNPGSGGAPIKLYTVDPITEQIEIAPDFGSPEAATYIENLKTRIEELEACLVSLGLLGSRG
ncbi:MAG: hypothetical protein ACRC3B_19105, partial [Bacteroidia bacterium]